MAAKNCTNVKISNHQAKIGQEDVLEAVKREMFSISGMLEGIKPLAARDRRRLADDLDATTKIFILSNGYLRTLCNSIGRGLTIEELQLITGEGKAELRYAFKKQIVKDLVNITKNEADGEKWINIILFQEKEDNAVDAIDLNGKQMLVPVNCVNKRSRPKRFQPLSGPLPEVIRFHNGAFDDFRRSSLLDEIIKDRLAAIELLKAYWNVYNFSRSIADSDQGPEIAENFGKFFRQTSENITQYAFRYQVLNAKTKHKRLIKCAQDVGIVGQRYFEFSAELADPAARMQVMIVYDRLLSEIQSRIDMLESLGVISADDLKRIIRKGNLWSKTGPMGHRSALGQVNRADF